MSRDLEEAVPVLGRFPRLRGDEPLGDITQINWATFSPPTRG